MKKYFAKYLPVEEEIKEGDKKLIPSTGAIVTDYKDGKELNEFLDCKKIKLFLCSRDIQVGDKVLSNSKEYEVVSIEENIQEDVEEWELSDAYKLYQQGLTHWYSFKGGGQGTSLDAFKVIGEISPDALGYVKEGDEFDESELQAYNHVYKLKPMKFEYMFRKFVKDAQNQYYIQIKGPCGHFH